MKKRIHIITALIACATAATTATATAYNVKALEFEGCECNSVCPCIFNSDTTFGDCRATLVFRFTGTHGETALQDTPCVVVVTKSGHNMGTTMGTWTGVVYMTEESSTGEKEAVNAILNDMTNWTTGPHRSGSGSTAMCMR